MINRLYATLRQSAKISGRSYRGSTYKPTERQIKQLSGLIPTAVANGVIDDVSVGEVFIDFIIKLLSCSPYWPKFIRNWDLNNTYEIEVIPRNISCMGSDFNPMAHLFAWLNQSGDISHSDFPYNPNDPPIDKLCAKLFAIVASDERD